MPYPAKPALTACDHILQTLQHNTLGGIRNQDVVQEPM